jgi:hypothetical protein
MQQPARTCPTHTLVLAENAIWVSVVLQSNCSDVSAYLILKLVQPLEGIEGFPLLYS